MCDLDLNNPVKGQIKVTGCGTLTITLLHTLNDCDPRMILMPYRT